MLHNEAKQPQNGNTGEDGVRAESTDAPLLMSCISCEKNAANDASYLHADTEAAAASQWEQMYVDQKR